MSSQQAHSLHLLFFPLMAQGHMLPMLDMAKLFADRGVRATILTTPANAPLIQPSIDRANVSGYPLHLALIPFPSISHGLPRGCENTSSIPDDASRSNFLEAVLDLRQPFDAVLKELMPDCIVTDTFLPWTYAAADELGIPRLAFHGMSFFAICAQAVVNENTPPEKVAQVDDESSFVIPGLPHRIEMLNSQVPRSAASVPVFAEIMAQIRDFEPKSYGVVVNSFCELEPEYVDYYRRVIGMKAWHVGPLALRNKDVADRSTRGEKASVGPGACLNWLDGRTPGSVVYVCFGSICEFSIEQLHNIALGLEASGRPFVWVVRKRGGSDSTPPGFEERILGRGLVIRGWAPQILILNHHAVGGFVTHCGWNSSLEGIAAGLPMVTWPLFAEQFYNERFIVDVLQTGVTIGAKSCSTRFEDRELVEAKRISEAVKQLMDDGEKHRERRRKANEIGEMARRAVQEGGSSYNDMSNLIQELIDRLIASGSNSNMLKYNL